MERHPDVANGTSKILKDSWLLLITLLNSQGKIERSLKQWQRTWQDMISAARQSVKYFLIGKKTTPVLRHHERIVDIVGFKYESKNEDNEVDDDDNDNDVQILPPSPKKLKPCSTSNISSSKIKQFNSAACSSANNFQPYLETAASSSYKNLKTQSSATKDKGDHLIKSLAEQFIQCFECQSSILKQSFEYQNNILLKNLPKIIAEQFYKVMANTTNKESSYLANAANDDNFIHNNDTDVTDALPNNAVEIADYQYDDVKDETEYDVEYLDELFMKEHEQHFGDDEDES